MELWGQIVSLFAMAAIILSFQCKSSKKLAVVLGAGAVLFAVSYLLLGQYEAVAINIISAIASVMCLKENFKNKVSFGVIFILFVVSAIFTYSGIWSLILMLAQLSVSYSIMFKSGKFIRNLRFFFVSPVWIINNTLVCFTIGGLVCEIITMVSIIVSFIRYRKTGFED